MKRCHVLSSHMPFSLKLDYWSSYGLLEMYG